MAIDIVMINNSSIMSDLVCSWSKSQQWSEAGASLSQVNAQQSMAEIDE